MKHIYYIIAFALGALSACQSTILYRGTLPAADCSGIEYSLRLGADNHKYSLETRYIDADGPGKDVRFKSHGSYEVIGSPSDLSQYYMLISESDSDTIYFKMMDEKTLRLLNDNMQEPMHPEHYDISSD